MTGHHPAIEFHRCVDGLSYRFEAAGNHNGKPCWKRIDADLQLHFSAKSGWIVCDGKGAISSRPWDVEKEEDAPLPPSGVWVSRKGSKSYVYMLKYIWANPAV